MNIPAKWAIKRTVEIGKWFDDRIGDGCNRYSKRTGNSILHYPSYCVKSKPFDRGSHGDDRVRDGYTLITYEQFLQYVVGENSNTYQIY